MKNLFKLSKRGISKYDRGFNIEISDFSYVTENQYNQVLNSLSKEHKNMFSQANKEKRRINLSFYDTYLKRDPYFEENPNDLVIDISNFSFKNFYLRDFITNSHVDHYLFLTVISWLILIYFILVFKRYFVTYMYGSFTDFDQNQAISNKGDNYHRLKIHLKKKYKDLIKEIEENENLSITHEKKLNKLFN